MAFDMDLKRHHMLKELKSEPQTGNPKNIVGM